jgi:formylglycine-generating enzyme required for sulfatase activity
MPVFRRSGFGRQFISWSARRAVLLALVVTLIAGASRGAVAADVPKAPREVKDADAKTEAEMKPYTDVIANAEVTFDMVPIKGGKFSMGSPDGEPGHKADEAPQHEVEISPFWMGKYEVTWNEYDVWTFALDVHRRQVFKVTATEDEKKADAVTRPTKPYTDMTFGMGKDGYPAISMTQLAARTYCQWLSEKTGRYYRLPTEAEWEYACRAGTTTAYSFGNDPAQLGDFAWYFENTGDGYHKVGKKKPNPWGLFDMHGNVAEWTLDQYVATGYQEFAGKVTKNPLVIPTKVYPEAVRGGAWTNDADQLRSAARIGSHKDWKQQDPQLPQSIWYFTDAQFLGFRIVRPLVEPTAEEKAKLWDAGVDK